MRSQQYDKTRIHHPETRNARPEKYFLLQAKTFDASTESGRMLALDHIFFQRVKLLAIMTKSFAESNPMGQHRRMAVRNNIDYICDTLGYVPTTEEIEMLKVA
ncbi:MAG: hypothetical protein JRE14_17085 [Deltaproteobacteria bacterium]|nr:hypothetical protein [Deltaproteobacteria bacterium]